MGDQASGLFSPYLRHARIEAIRPFLGTGTILDFGCGIGSLALYIPPSRYLGIDIDKESLATARVLNPSHSFSTPDNFQNGENHARFDLVVALAIIEHLDDLLKWMKEMTCVLKDGGVLLITTPNPRFQSVHHFGARLGFFSKEAAEEHKGFFGVREIRSLVNATGLMMKSHKYFLFISNQLFVLKKRT